MKPPFFISLFDTTKYKFTLSNLIRESVDLELADVTQKMQLDAIACTLEELGTKIMICEIDYVDRGYLDDYLNYYVGCHAATPKTCSRIHFFAGDDDYLTFGYEDFEKIISGERDESKLGEYFGFMVVKPIPMTFIGRTCLKIPPKFNNKNTRMISREYTADLFGMKRTFSSLAFQEQDRVTSACTSASIWCLLHALGKKNVVSPAKITLAATEANKIINSFPCSGLNSTEIERALEHFGLKQWFVRSDSENEVNQAQISSYVKAYIDSDIPLILGGEWSSLSANNSYKVEGDHAVTIIGYQTNEQNKIEKLIVLDDRRGPYTVLRFVNSFSVKVGVTPRTVLVTEDQYLEQTDDRKYNDVMSCNALTIATDPRIRVSYRSIAQTATMLTTMFTNLANTLFYSEHLFSLEWSARLLKSTSFKKEVKDNLVLDSASKLKLLTRNLPKNVWVITISGSEGNMFDIILDSTSLPQGDAYIDVVYYGNNREFVEPHIDKLYKDQFQILMSRTNPEENYHLSILRNLALKTNSHFAYLDEKFGVARMPQQIKDTEIADFHLNNQSNLLYLQNSFDSKSDTSQDRFIDLFNKQAMVKKQWAQEDAALVHRQTLIWVISKYGALLIGEDSSETGHPTLTGAKPARIGGELIRKQDEPDTIYVNFFSGRYSANFDNPPEKLKFLQNAMVKINDILGNNGYEFKLDDRLNTV
ncbi:hypothetical protein ACQKC5_18465 [Shewanella baltica]|uniref:hypothetical protein n=1 Tax=Shewanella baltica TaxID=62322 RepID=UPI003CFF0C4C